MLKMESLESRRLRADLLFTYKLLTGSVTCSVSKNVFYTKNNNRGHALRYKLVDDNGKEICPKTVIFRNFILNRVMKLWNSLPPNIFAYDKEDLDVDVRVAIYKKQLRTISLSKYLKYNI